ncbi:MAG: hypothetical protein ACYTG5_17740 [Planctomycetota bacterium]
MLVLAQVLCFLLIAIALVRPASRALAALILALSALGALAAASMSGGASRELEITHSFVAFVGNEIRDKAFPIETCQASASLWLLIWAGFALIWASWAWLRRARPGQEKPGSHPFWAPLLLALSGCALSLAWEKAAAPAELVRPASFDRVLVPASLAAVILLAQRCRGLMLTLSWLTLFVSICRIPLALFSTLASQRSWGTSLDIHSIQVFANPFVQYPVEVTAGSSEQFAWLIWAPQLIIYPSLYMLSFGGIAFAAVMFVTHPKEQAS